MLYNAGNRIFILCNVIFVFKRQCENNIYSGYIPQWYELPLYSIGLFDKRPNNNSYYYITLNYMPCNIPPALLNIRLAILISRSIRNITVGPGPISVTGPAFLQFDWLVKLAENCCHNTEI